MGFGDFAKGLVDDVGGAVVDTVQDLGGAAANTVKAAAYVANPTKWDDIAEGVGGAASFIAKNPGQAWDTGFEVGRYMLKEELKPQNLIMNAALLATGVGATALVAKAGMAAKGATTAVELTRGQRFLAAAGRTMAKADEVLAAPQRAQTAIMKHLPGAGRLTEFRAGQAEKVMDLARGNSWGEAALRPVARSVAGGDLAATGRLASPGGYSQAAWRLNKVESLDPRNIRETSQTVADVTQAVAHPEKAAAELGQAAWNEYGDEAMSYAAKKAPGLIGKALTGGKAKKESTSSTPYQMPETQAIGMTQFSLDQKHATKVSRRQPNSTAQIATVTDDSTMPSKVGPTDWYGPQGGYQPGRGFKQPLSPLEQPNSMMGI